MQALVDVGKGHWPTQGNRQMRDRPSTSGIWDHHPKPIGLKKRDRSGRLLLSRSPSRSLARVSNPPRASDPSSSLRPRPTTFSSRREGSKKRKEKKKLSRIGKISRLRYSIAFLLSLSLLIHRSDLNPKVQVEVIPLIADL